MIFEDANIENAVMQNSKNFLWNSGQICYAASRVLVQESIAPKFIEAVKKAFEDDGRSDFAGDGDWSISG